MKKILVLLLVLSLNEISFAQYGAVPFLTLQQSPLLHGAGQIGASVPNSDAIGFYYNPAQLGYFSRENNFSTFFMPQNTKWLNNYLSGYTFRSFGLSAGYNFNKNENSLPISVGIGYIHNKLSYGFYYDSKGIYESYESFDCFSVGASLDYYLLFNLGFSIKPFHSKLDNISGGDANSTASDFGTMITAPFAKLFFNNLKFALNNQSFLKPKVDLTLGCSITNIGKEISYIDAAQADPISRTARLGYTLELGFDLLLKQTKINFFNYSFTAEAEDILIKNKSNAIYISVPPYEYQNLFGDIIIGKHLFELIGDENVVVHKGHIFRLFDSFIFTTGRFDGRGYYNRKTNGYGLSSDGIFKLLNSAVDNPIINFISNHFVIEYFDTNTFVDSGLDTNFKGFALYLKRFEL
jgi:hypothetical protein